MVRASFSAVLMVFLVGLGPWWSIHSLESKEGRLLVGMTIVPNAKASGAVCLDGSSPAYHLHEGSGAGARNWLLQFEGGGWCQSVQSCLERSTTRRGSTKYMRKEEVFSGILSNDFSVNPDFYNWNRVKLRYCDGASFGGDSVYHDGTTTLYFRGQRIWDAIIQDLLPKGLSKAEKVLLSGCSAGGLATFLHCDDLAHYLPEATIMKCLSDAGFFLDVRDILGNYNIRTFFTSVVTIQEVQKNLNRNCKALHNPDQCFFPQYALTYIRSPYFILNSAYDVYQFNHILVPPSADPQGRWSNCKLNPAACNADEISTLQGFRDDMLTALGSFSGSRNGGMFINSCFAHCQSEMQETWFASNSPRVQNKRLLVIDTSKGRNPRKLTAHILVIPLVITSYNQVRQGMTPHRIQICGTSKDSADYSKHKVLEEDFFFGKTKLVLGNFTS